MADKCKKNNYDLCLNGASCDNKTGNCKCARGWEGRRCQRSSCLPVEGLSQKTQKCVDVDAFVMLAETPSIPWKKSLGNPISDDFISASHYLTGVVYDLLNSTLNTFVEARVTEFSPRTKGIAFRTTVKLQEGRAGWDQQIWFRWVKRAVDYASIESGRAVFIDPTSIQVFDVDECALEIHNCDLEAECFNQDQTELQLKIFNSEQDGSYECRCLDPLVDLAAINGERPGTECLDVCGNATDFGTVEYCHNDGVCINALDSFEPICACEYGFSGDKCEIRAESFAMVFLLWGICFVVVVSTAMVCVYNAVAKKKGRVYALDKRNFVSEDQNN